MVDGGKTGAGDEELSDEEKVVGADEDEEEEEGSMLTPIQFSVNVCMLVSRSGTPLIDFSGMRFRAAMIKTMRGGIG